MVGGEPEFVRVVVALLREDRGHLGAAVALLLLGPITCLMGGTLTVLIRAVARVDEGERGWPVGLLYGINTLGAALGAILGGGSGAAKGAAIGGAGGTGVVLATKGKEVRLGPGAAITTRLTAPLTVRVRS